MSPTTFFRAIVLAFVLAFVGAAAHAVLSLGFTAPVAFKLVVALLAALYGGAVLYGAEEKSGRILVPLLWLVLTAVGFALLQPVAFLFAQIGAIWLLRSLYFHTGPLAALLDLGLTVCAFGAALWAAGTGSWFMMIWSFFLVQSFTALIPQAVQPMASTDDGERRKFQHARAQAQAALQKLVTH